MKRIMNWALALVLIVSVGVMAQSCKTTNESTTVLASTMNGTWILKSLNGENAADIFTGKTPSMTIDMVTSAIFGNSGCNGYRGTFKLKDGVFSAANLIGTMMFCDNAPKEPNFLEALGKESKITVNNSVLTLTSNGAVIAEFVRGVDQAALIGEWILENLEGEDLKTFFPIQDKVSTMKFDITEGKVYGNAGCNRYNATYKIEGNVITFGPAMTTRMTCPNISGESKFTKALAEPSELTVSSKELLLTKDGKTILKFIKK